MLLGIIQTEAMSCIMNFLQKNSQIAGSGQVKVSQEVLKHGPDPTR